MTSAAFRGSSDRGILILTSLANGPKHGYALIKDVADFACVKMGAGTLYGALAKLEADGLVRALPAEKRRHPYELTAAGAAFLQDRLVETSRIAAVGLRRLTVSPL